jgi:hypothetical protein
LIDTPLQRGVASWQRRRTVLTVFFVVAAAETVKTVFRFLITGFHPLKRGVNKRILGPQKNFVMHPLKFKPDTSFNPGTGAGNTVRALALQGYGKVTLAGAYQKLKPFDFLILGSEEFAGNQTTETPRH